MRVRECVYACMGVCVASVSVLVSVSLFVSESPCVILCVRVCVRVRCVPAPELLLDEEFSCNPSPPLVTSLSDRADRPAPALRYFALNTNVCMHEFVSVHDCVELDMLVDVDIPSCV